MSVKSVSFIFLFSALCCVVHGRRRYFPGYMCEATSPGDINNRRNGLPETFCRENGMLMRRNSVWYTQDCKKCECGENFASYTQGCCGFGYSEPGSRGWGRPAPDAPAGCTTIYLNCDYYHVKKGSAGDYLDCETGDPVDFTKPIHVEVLNP
ncbi:uncharacterized protein LOC106164184 [Lingula anatina]|uniref:Uncharacterized protein LOC106164184 n=1 Tax=Lingula anatina TaxID=7574 RepID=A0A1S3IHU2_LINAN|nr:uncharacterized protein LOC106164184 [Lingula anatina]|eukprot:XP_013397446.1 uncharacterized protein LOC106164184 [Lingula anatina]